MKSYAWSCLACEASNAADASACSVCGCPARATSAEVDRARQVWRQRRDLPAVERFDWGATLRALPLLLIAAGALGLLGGVALTVSAAGSYPSLMAFGALLVALAALCLSSYRQPA